MKKSVEHKEEEALQGRQFGRRTVLGLLTIGAIGGMIGLRMFRYVGFRKREISAPAPQKRIRIKPNPLAVSRMNKGK